MDLLLIAVLVTIVAAPFVAVLLLVRLWNRLVRAPLREPVAGIMTITSMPLPSMDGFVPNLGDLLPAHEEFVAEGWVELPGRDEPYAAAVRDAAWTGRWPEVGQRIPVLVERRDLRRVRIHWEALRAMTRAGRVD